MIWLLLKTDCKCFASSLICPRTCRNPLITLLLSSLISLQRVKNSLIKQYFTKFAGGHFEPNNKLAYMYPLDQFSICSRALAGLDIVKETRGVESRETPELMKAKMDIARGMQEISNRLLLPLSEASCQPHEDVNGTPTLLSSLKSYILSMPTRDVAPSQNSEGAIPLLAKLYHFHVKINAMLATRKSNQVHKEHIHYSLGQIVRHKLYGFRGVIVAWDPKPRMDVSNWDGLAGIERPQEKPFYHVYPDVNDCISVFGGPRHFRYVCQENLELSPVEETPLDVEVHLDPEEWKWLSDEGRYLPSSEMKVS
jgi:hemimethylated DNA binding protein